MNKADPTSVMRYDVSGGTAPNTLAVGVQQQSHEDMAGVGHVLTVLWLVCLQDWGKDVPWQTVVLSGGGGPLAGAVALVRACVAGDMLRWKVSRVRI